jgi:ATP-dependent exoDNAse (exonuclease V) alpha subunit
MEKIVVQIDSQNKEFTQAVEIVLNQRKSLFLTGRAGSGKTYFLKYIKEQCNEQGRNVAVVAPTGIAALNAGGQTIHSFFQVPISIFPPDDKRLRIRVPSDDTDKVSIYNIFTYHETRKNIIKNLDLLIIDEVSMLRCDLLDLIDQLLRVFRGKDKDLENTPFGGVQVVLIGDPFQLPPVTISTDWDILEQYYESPWFFSSKAFASITELIELQKIYRQTDKKFIELLNKVRDNSVEFNDLQQLNERYNPTFKNRDKSKKYMNITTHNNAAERENERELQKLPAELHTFLGRVQGVFPQNNLPAPLYLSLKEGAQVMLVKNDSNHKYVNGSLGEITGIEDGEITIKLDNGLTFELEKATWNNIEYVWNRSKKRIEENVIGKFIQFPLKLAWCITVHKSQGLTFDYVIADLSAAFATGQVYVALSRCTSLDGLVLKTEIPYAIKTDMQVLNFYGNKIKKNK